MKTRTRHKRQVSSDASSDPYTTAHQLLCRSRVQRLHSALGEPMSLTMQFQLHFFPETIQRLLFKIILIPAYQLGASVSAFIDTILFGIPK